MRKIIAILLLLSIFLSVCGCGSNGSTITVATNSDDIAPGSIFGYKGLIEIGNGIWYDQSTRIVYWWNGYMGTSQIATTPSPYYAPNGLPYRYNPATNTFEEIE